MVRVFWRKNEWQPAFCEAKTTFERSQLKKKNKFFVSVDIFYCNETGSSAFNLGLAKSMHYPMRARRNYSLGYKPHLFDVMKPNVTEDGITNEEKRTSVENFPT